MPPSLAKHRAFRDPMESKVNLRLCSPSPPLSELEEEEGEELLLEELVLMDTELLLELEELFLLLELEELELLELEELDVIATVLLELEELEDELVPALLTEEDEEDEEDLEEDEELDEELITSLTETFVTEETPDGTETHIIRGAADMVGMKLTMVPVEPPLDVPKVPPRDTSDEDTPEVLEKT